MTGKGIANTLNVMTKAFPSYRLTDTEGTARVWMGLLREYTDEDIAIALATYIKSDRSGFAPSIGQLIDLIPKEQDLSEMEAWSIVNRAIRNGNYGAESEYLRLPREIQLAVGSAAQIREWASMDISELQTVAQSNFMRSYRTVKERERKASVVPVQYKALYSKDPDLPQIEAVEEQELYEGIPMPEDVKRRRYEQLEGQTRERG